MKKFTFSLLGGIMIGIVLAFSLWDYSGATYEIIGQAGVDRTIKEMDFAFLFNTSLIVLAFTVLIYLVWTFIEKKKHEKFLAEFNRDKKSDN